MSAFAEAHCSLRLTEVEEVEIVSSLPHFLRWAPIFAAPEIKNVADETTLTVDTDFLWTERGGLFYLTGQGAGPWKLTYTVGYNVAHPIPNDLVLALAEIEKLLAQGTGMGGETLGDYSYTLPRKTELYLMIPSAMSVLDAYKRWAV